MHERGWWERFRRSEDAAGLALISPTLIVGLALLAAPLGLMVIYSFLTDSSVPASVEWVFTLENYRAIFAERLYTAILERSLYVSVLVTAVTVLLAFPVAYYVSFHVAPNRKSLWLFLITIPFWTSYLIRVFLWKVILGYNGVVNSGLKTLGLIDDPLSFLLYNVNSIVITLAHAYAPFAILPIFVALEKIDRSLLEAGQDLGESRLMTFWRVTLPLAMPGVVAAVLIVLIPTVGDYVTPEVIGGGKIPMIANLIQNRMLGLDNRPLGAALAVVAMAAVGLLSLAFVLANRRFLKKNAR
ncbi:ABC transporter permease [Frigidibacter sp. MR17.24]|uniref:ABC transporter permease n=1 Tax=Frigidibacter sp. MR17.24 TaxID=3127345 RepID=UPI00301313E1